MAAPDQGRVVLAAVLVVTGFLIVGYAVTKKLLSRKRKPDHSKQEESKTSAKQQETKKEVIEDVPAVKVKVNLQSSKGTRTVVTERTETTRTKETEIFTDVDEPTSVAPQEETRIKSKTNSDEKSLQDGQEGGVSETELQGDGRTADNAETRLTESNVTGSVSPQEDTTVVNAEPELKEAGITESKDAGLVQEGDVKEIASQQEDRVTEAVLQNNSLNNTASELTESSTSNTGIQESHSTDESKEDSAMENTDTESQECIAESQQDDESNTNSRGSQLQQENGAENLNSGLKTQENNIYNALQEKEESKSSALQSEQDEEYRLVDEERTLLEMSDAEEQAHEQTKKMELFSLEENVSNVERVEERDSRGKSGNSEMAGELEETSEAAGFEAEVRTSTAVWQPAGGSVVLTPAGPEKTTASGTEDGVSSDIIEDSTDGLVPTSQVFTKNDVTNRNMQPEPTWTNELEEIEILNDNANNNMEEEEVAVKSPDLSGTEPTHPAVIGNQLSEQESTQKSQPLDESITRQGKRESDACEGNAPKDGSTIIAEGSTSGPTERECNVDVDMNSDSSFDFFELAVSPNDFKPSFDIVVPSENHQNGDRNSEDDIEVISKQCESGEVPLTFQEESAIELSMDDIEDAFTAALEDPSSIELQHLGVLVSLVLYKDQDLQHAALSGIARCAAFTTNQNALREFGCLMKLYSLLHTYTMAMQVGCSVSPAMISSVIMAITNMAVNETNQVQLKDCVPLLVDLMLDIRTKETVQLSSLQALTNLSTTPEHHGQYTRLVQHLYGLLDTGSAAIRIQALKVLVNLSCGPDMVPHLLAAKAPQCLLELLLHTSDEALVLRWSTLLANIVHTVRERQLSQSSLPTLDKAPSPETIYSVLYGIHSIGDIKNKVFLLGRHKNEDIRYQAARVYSGLVR